MRYNTMCVGILSSSRLTIESSDSWNDLYLRTYPLFVCLFHQISEGSDKVWNANNTKHAVLPILFEPSEALVTSGGVK